MKWSYVLSIFLLALFMSPSASQATGPGGPTPGEFWWCQQEVTTCIGAEGLWLFCRQRMGARPDQFPGCVSGGCGFPNLYGCEGR